jgi:hypothetical protein
MAFFVRFRQALMCFLIPHPLRPRRACARSTWGATASGGIVGSFDNGRYSQRNIEVRMLSVGDDVTRYGRITDARFAEIERTLTRVQARVREGRRGTYRGRRHGGVPPGTEWTPSGRDDRPLVKS